jgi:hypothetical protein
MFLFGEEVGGRKAFQVQWSFEKQGRLSGLGIWAWRQGAEKGF